MTITFSTHGFAELLKLFLEAIGFILCVGGCTLAALMALFGFIDGMRQGCICGCEHEGNDGRCVVCRRRM